MLQGWRLKLREAELAEKRDCLDEAAKLLFSEDLRSVRQAKSLASRVADKLAWQAIKLFHADDRNGGWQNLNAARALSGDSSEYLAARNEFITRIFALVECRLTAGDSSGALVAIDELERHQVAGSSLKTFKEGAQRLASARRLGSLGKFAEADGQFAQAEQVLGNHQSIVERLRQESRVKGTRYQENQAKLACFMNSHEWSKAAEVVDALLELAPENIQLREIQRGVSAKLKHGAQADLSGTVALARGRRGNYPPAEETKAVSKLDQVPTLGRRFLLWVDAVGGFMVCLGNEVVLGQATPGNRVDIPILGDVSRKHARIVRETGSYIVEPLQAVLIDGKPISGRTLLSDGDELDLGRGVRLRFRQPHALSATARLEFVSHHRMQPAADAVLLMAESCVMGPAWRNHVVCRDWSRDVVIFRQDDSLFCRASDSLEVDGIYVSGRGRLTSNSRIVGTDFSMSLEELDKWTN